jgi:hypothetical protein
MKMIVTLILLVLSSNAFAAGTCPDLNGVYKVDNITAVRLTQNSCVSLSIAWGSIQELGKIEWSGVERATLNGARTCGAFGCVTAEVSADQIELSRFTPWASVNAVDGICDFYQVNYSLNAQGQLVKKNNIFNCKDTFMGWVETVLPRIN